MKDDTVEKRIKHAREMRTMDGCHGADGLSLVELIQLSLNPPDRNLKIKRSKANARLLKQRRFIQAEDRSWMDGAPRSVWRLIYDSGATCKDDAIYLFNAGYYNPENHSGHGPKGHEALASFLGLPRPKHAKKYTSQAIMNACHILLHYGVKFKLGDNVTAEPKAVCAHIQASEGIKEPAINPQ